MIKHILFSTDLGAFTSFALDYVESLVSQYEAQVTIVHAVPPIEDLTKAIINSYCSNQVKQELLQVSEISGVNDVLRDQVFDLLTAANSAKYDDGVVLRNLSDIIIRTGNPVTVILNEAQRIQCDLIVVGSHSANAVDRHLMGSVASKVLQLSKVPVFMVPMLNPASITSHRSGHPKTFGP